MKNNQATPLSTSPPSLFPPDTYIYSILPLATDADAAAAAPTALATISSDDTIRLFDCATLQPFLLFSAVQRHEGVTCLRGNGPWCVLTAGRDGVVRGWDLRVGMVYEIRDEKCHAPFLALDSQGVKVATGAEYWNNQAAVTIWDYRSTTKPLVQYPDSHNDDVTAIQFHPTDTVRLLSGSMDGLINIYDTRIVDEDDALMNIINHDSSISHAGFLSDNDVYAVSHDESFAVHPLGDESMSIFGDLRPVLKSDYIVDIIGSCNNEAIVGAGSHSHEGNQHLDLVPLQFDTKWSFASDQTIRIPGGHGSEIIRSFCFNQPAQTIFTAGEDGLVRAWRAPALHREDSDHGKRKEKHSEEKAGTKRKKMKIEGNENERQRHRP